MKIFIIILASVIVSGTSTSMISSNTDNDSISGAWEAETADGKLVMVIQHGYWTITSYDIEGKQFFYTHGGAIEIDKDRFTLNTDFHSAEKEKAAKKVTYRFSRKENELTVDDGKHSIKWKLIDNSSTAITGCWRINGRLNEGKMSELKLGARKSLKILSGTRFQWMAINSETMEFFGTGGGTYTLKDGKYTEHIEFFSRDSSRIGASLSFNAKVQNGVWHHSGLSSKGDAIHETWIPYPEKEASSTTMRQR